MIPILGPPRHLRSHSPCRWKVSSLRDRYGGPGVGNLLKERLEVNHHCQWLHGVVGRALWRFSAYYPHPEDVYVLFLECAGG